MQVTGGPNAATHAPSGRNISTIRPAVLPSSIEPEGSNDETTGTILLDLWAYPSPCAGGRRRRSEIPDVDVMVKRVPETLSPDSVQMMEATEAQRVFANVPIATADDLVEPDAIIFGISTRFGNMAGQIRQFLDATGGLWA
jgi:hypothetical protein